jgi:hypothetical protein
VPNRRPALKVAQVLAWADAHHARAGGWPNAGCGAVGGAPGECWRRIDQALAKGLRGLPGGGSLARLLRRERGARNPADLPPLSEEQVLAWADAHRRRSGRWPTSYSGAVGGAAGEGWKAIDVALRSGGRGLPGGTTLARLLFNGRGRPLFSRG